MPAELVSRLASGRVSSERRAHHWPVCRAPIASPSRRWSASPTAAVTAPAARSTQLVAKSSSRATSSSLNEAGGTASSASRPAQTRPIAAVSTGDGGAGVPGARQSSSVVTGSHPLIDSAPTRTANGLGVRALYRVVVDEQVHEGMSRILLTC